MKNFIKDFSKKNPKNLNETKKQLGPDRAQLGHGRVPGVRSRAANFHISFLPERLVRVRDQPGLSGWAGPYGRARQRA